MGARETEKLQGHADIEVHRERPFNAETPPSVLRRSFVTPTNLFYSRNHGAIPEVDPVAYRLAVSGLVETPLELSLQEIQDNFPKRESTATLYCAGNRRRELMELSDMPGKVPWGGGATGNARWAGAGLRDVLEAAGIQEEARHAAFTGLDRDEENGTGTHYGGSVPVERALGDDALLAYEMNGEALPVRHGFPVRVVVGGYIGARSVKWLAGITLQRTPSDNHYQAREYKLFPPHVTAETCDYSQGEMLGEIPINAVICTPEQGETFTENSVPVRGYAIVGGDRRVERVEVSSDGGKTWTRAELEDEDHPSAWRFWRANLHLGAGTCQIICRAVDSEGEEQPEEVASVWNFQGYANNAWHRVNVRFDG